MPIIPLQEQHLAPRPTELEHFGTALGISRDGRVMVVGTEALARDPNHLGDVLQDLAGRIYVIIRNDARAVVATEPIPGPVPPDGHWFGATAAVSPDGEQIIVGDWGTGKAWVYTRRGELGPGNEWNHPPAELVPDPRVEESHFGHTVSIADGHVAAVGALNSSTDTREAGMAIGGVHIFRDITRPDGVEGWQQEALLQPPPVINDQDPWISHFGKAIELSADGGRILVGSFLRRDRVTGAGRAYVYRFGGNPIAVNWNLEATLQASADEDFDDFGRSVGLSLNGSTACVGAPRFRDLDVDRRGAAFVFHQVQGWQRPVRLQRSDVGERENELGISVSLSDAGRSALVGAQAVEVATRLDSHAAYLFTTDVGIPWREHAILSPVPELTADAEAGHNVALSRDGVEMAVSARRAPAPDDPGPPERGALRWAGIVFTGAAPGGGDERRERNQRDIIDGARPGLGRFGRFGRLIGRLGRWIRGLGRGGVNP